MARRLIRSMIVGAAVSGLVAGGCDTPKPKPEKPKISEQLKCPEGFRCEPLDPRKREFSFSNITVGDFLEGYEHCKPGKRYKGLNEGRIIWGEKEILRFMAEGSDNVGSTIRLKTPGGEYISVMIPYISPRIFLDIKTSPRRTSHADVLIICPPKLNGEKINENEVVLDKGSLEKTKIQRLKWNGYKDVPVDE